jgi:hypothetical protein
MRDFNGGGTYITVLGTMPRRLTETIVDKGCTRFHSALMAVLLLSLEATEAEIAGMDFVDGRS